MKGGIEGVVEFVREDLEGLGSVSESCAGEYAFRLGVKLERHGEKHEEVEKEEEKESLEEDTEIGQESLEKNDELEKLDDFLQQEQEVTEVVWERDLGGKRDDSKVSGEDVLEDLVDEGEEIGDIEKVEEVEEVEVEETDEVEEVEEDRGQTEVVRTTSSG